MTGERVVVVARVVRCWVKSRNERSAILCVNGWALWGTARDNLEEGGIIKSSCPLFVPHSDVSKVKLECELGSHKITSQFGLQSPARPTPGWESL